MSKYAEGDFTMSLLPIVSVNRNSLELQDVSLRCRSKNVDIESKHSKDVVQQVIEDMFETLYESHPVGGVGLSAPQVGINLRISIIDYKEGKKHHLYVLINPKYLYKSEEKVLGRESCLSFPTLSGEVSRFKEVSVEAYDHNFVKREFNVSGWLARIFQHELDHLDGVLYCDRLKSLDELDKIDFPYIRQLRATTQTLYGEKAD